MSKKSISGRSLENSITTDDILGKDVIDSDGIFVGVIERVLIDPSRLKFLGIGIDRGILKKGLLIGKGYIGRIAENAIFLKIKVPYEIVGMEVFDNVGAKVGKVSEVKLSGKRSSIKSIKVKNGLFRKEIEIPFESIDSIGYGVILNVQKEKLMS